MSASPSTRCVRQQPVLDDRSPQHTCCQRTPPLAATPPLTHALTRLERARGTHRVRSGRSTPPRRWRQCSNSWRRAPPRSSCLSSRCDQPTHWPFALRGVQERYAGEQRHTPCRHNTSVPPEPHWPHTTSAKLPSPEPQPSTTRGPHLQVAGLERLLSVAKAEMEQVRTDLQHSHQRLRQVPPTPRGPWLRLCWVYRLG